MRAVGFFSDLAYYPSLVAAINSLLHFGVQARIKVYDFDGLPHLARTYLARHATVVQPPAEILHEPYREHWYYRPRFLAAAIDPCELVLDADTVILSDLEEAFRAVAAGAVAVVREWEYVHPDSLATWDYADLPADSVFHRRLAHPEVYRQGLPIYNGGLLGFHRDAHRELLDLWRETTEHHEALGRTFFALDQHSLSLLLAALARAGKVAVRELPPELWMQTWAGHREPRKLLAWEDGRPALYNGDRSRPMRFYHFTGDILAPPATVGGREKVPVRFAHLVSDVGLPPGLTQAQMRRAWHEVWRGRHGSPAGELPGLFYDLGPLRAPRCLDPAWRELLGRVLAATRTATPAAAAAVATALRASGAARPAAGASPGPRPRGPLAAGRHPAGPPPFDKDSREVWALALAHDYVDYCGYRTGDMGWLEPALAALLGPERRAAGERTVAWERDADVALAFTASRGRYRAWAGGEPGAPAACGECHQGVHLTFREAGG